ncbi:hypothetical protein PN465_13425 [Nodularia spumigena CS-584]|uniref:Uncharacterized protein n=1 Tax=Nodularia spumigena UHCC 0060 TaxID=3110300 RepID=A0ABU5UUT5_NODSP|nr:hypothetical protein [Nodularia spumigena]AHJ27802.1 hypothetical protein NSP_14680 [Nodularia spumigena CCY9414]MDB9383210.1 hypothetical protein [Nodularia spumigena CS-584]MEA5526795.1 hypothetical protein [Nodularia spumigena UHCC 0143]MEA5608830.1 hypothetical protein [Nodularia spumigena UHCC 0060]
MFHLVSSALITTNRETPMKTDKLVPNLIFLVLSPENRKNRRMRNT